MCVWQIKVLLTNSFLLKKCIKLKVPSAAKKSSYNKYIGQVAVWDRFNGWNIKLSVITQHNGM